MHKMQVDARVSMPATSDTPAPTPPTNAVCWAHQENTLRANEPKYRPRPNTSLAGAAQHDRASREASMAYTHTKLLSL